MNPRLNPFFFRAAPALLASLGLAGCATLSEPLDQQLEVHAILEHREVAGVGCLLANDLGRWFVVAPGRVTVARSTRPLAIYCKREGVGSADEWWASRYDTGHLLGDVVVSAGLGYFVDRRSGAGFSYPATLTVVMHGPRADAQGEPPAADNRMF